MYFNSKPFWSTPENITFEAKLPGEFTLYVNACFTVY